MSLSKVKSQPMETTNHEGQVLHLTGLDGSSKASARPMTLWETISASWIICNSWAGIAATIALAITLGGPAILIYGPVVMFFLVGCCSITLAELASVYPTAGGQYHWTSILAPKKLSRGLVRLCSPAFQETAFVWDTVLNGSGWDSETVAFLVGLVSPNYMYAGIDGALHLAEECTNAETVIPRALLSTVTIGFVTSFAFMIAMVYCVQDFDTVISTTTGIPIYELWYQATSSRIAATFFLCLLLLAVIFALNGAHQTASRLTWSFARDSACWGDFLIRRMHPDLEVPVYALLTNFGIMFVIGCVYLGSTSAFNAIIGTGLTLQHITYAVPAVLVIYRKRSKKVLPRDRAFAVPDVLGYVANVVTVLTAVLALVFYNFPTMLPSTDYGAAVLAVMALFGLINWVGHARKHFQGPRLAESDM
ncbi:hypothetical protein KJ359_001094 [Pestalotiopsis sp. 9143b]|nr:hypothetical protein KJ359_001094 [Pestalotiopsis sp. 9143b]